MSGIGFGNSQALNRVPIMGGYDAMASAYFAAVPNAFTSARKTIINTLIAGLRADGNLTKLDRLWLLANSTTGNAVIDIIGLNAATLVNAPAFVEDQGYTGDGATSYINSNFSPNPDATNFTQNSSSFGVYVNTDDGTSPGIAMGVAQGGTSYNTVWPKEGGIFYGTSTDSGAIEVSVATANCLSLSVAQRVDASNVDIYKAGVLVASGARTSGLVTTIPFFILAHNSGVASSFFGERVALAFLGSNTINQSTLYTRIQAYMTAIGA